MKTCGPENAAEFTDFCYIFSTCFPQSIQCHFYVPFYMRKHVFNVNLNPSRLKAFMKPFTTLQRSVKIKTSANLYFDTTF